MSPCLLLYGLAALVGGTLGGPAGRLAAVVLVAAVLARQLLAHPLPTRRAAARR
jgi:hypothetical protein